MEPTKGSHSRSLVLCGAPAKKAPEPPDSNKPSILKALEAVVAAGRRGLLGPAAMAAVEAMPELDLEYSAGKAGQETPNSTPLVEEKKEGKEIANKECNPAVAVVPPVEDPGSWQPAMKAIWICGNSVIHVSKLRVQCSRQGLQLGFPTSVAFLYWRGISAMMWDDVLPTLQHIYLQRSSPSIIVVHAGESDLLSDSSCSLVARMQNDLDLLRRAFPGVVVIWSSLFPGRSRVVDSERNSVNSKMEKYCQETGTCYLSHPLITSDNKFRFLRGNALSQAGIDTFIAELKEVLRTYLFPNQL